MKETNVLQQVDDYSYQELMHEAQRLAHFGGWEVNILTGDVKWSPEMYNLLGYNPLTTKATFKNFIKKLYREDILYVKGQLERLLRMPSTDTYDFRVVDKTDDSIKYLRTGIVVKRDVNGKAVSMTGFSHDITAQKLAEQKIENVNRELKAFFQIVDDVFFSIDIRAQKIIQMSPGCEKIYGYKVNEMEASLDFVTNIVFPADHLTVTDAYIKLLKGETILSQHRIIAKDSAIRWVESKIIPTLDTKGLLMRIDGVTRDITDRKNIELERQRAEQRYRQIVESAQEGIWTIDEHNLTNFVNDKMFDILGYTAEEMMGKGLFYFMDEKDRAYAEECLERRKKGAKENLDFRYVTKNGRHVWTNISTNPIFNENGAYKGALAMVTDITERRQWEDSLKKSETNLRTVFDHTDMGFVLFGASLKVASFNVHANNFFVEQHQKELQTGLTATSYFTGHKRNFFNKLLSKVKKQEIVNYETNFYTKPHGIKWYDVKWVGVYNEQSEFMGLLLTFKNITEKKVLELEREKITADLVQRNKDQEQFNYIISHNLRAPVANISGLVELLERPDLPQEEKEYVMTGISKSVKKLDSVIKDMNHVLQVKELTNETNELNNLAQIVDDIKTSIQNIIVKEKVVINCSFVVEHLFTVRSYLYSVFYNLILNSIKYRQAGIKPIIAIKSISNKDCVILTFTDNGKGIDLKKHGNQLFRLYKRFDTSVEGKGMGLFMVKTQVESLGGTITVNSELEKGTEFVIKLPVER
jgi:PAS domain S-box-containing protein